MKRDFLDRVVLVTGASRGIGRAIAIVFARRGAKVVVAARSAAALEAVARELRDLGAECVAVPTDVTSGTEVQAMIDAVKDRYGRIDVLVNNAGIGRVGRIDAGGFAEDIDQSLQASLYGMIRVTQAALPLMKERRSGTIVNMSSVMGRKAFARFGSYAIVMHAVSALSDALRQELQGSGIRVSVIHPALTATDLLRDADESEMPPPFRHLTPLAPEQVADAVVAAVRRGTRRVVLPRMANMLLLAEALSPRLGDAVAHALTIRPIARLLGMSRGRTYHQVVLGRSAG